MLPKETKEVSRLREIFGYYTNQCLHEAKRVNKYNFDVLREHYSNMCQAKCQHLNESLVIWADFLAHFASYKIKEDPTEKRRESV